MAWHWQEQKYNHFDYHNAMADIVAVAVAVYSPASRLKPGARTASAIPPQG